MYLHLKQALLLGLDALQQRRVGELELVVLGRVEGVVRLGLGNDLDEVAPLLVKLTYLLAYWSRSRGRDGIAYPKIVTGDAIDLAPM